MEPPIVIDYSRDQLYSYFENEYTLRTIDDTHFNYIYSYLEDLDCKKMIIEEEYIDRDYLDDFSNYYVRCFNPYSRYCKRVHFFKCIKPMEVEQIFYSETGDPKNTAELRKEYLGFLVIKPLPQTIIGRTILKTPPQPEELSEEIINKCTREYIPSLWGIKLPILSIAFQEQDSVIASCATSAIWSALQITSHEFNKYIPTPYEITTNATQIMHKKRPIPTSGLDLYQISQSIKSIGLEPENKEYYDSHSGLIRIPFVNYCYSYLNSGFPVVLALDIIDDHKGKHAITLTGYKISTDRPETNDFEFMAPSYPELHFKGSRIKSFIGHDDQLGPFTEFELHYKEKKPNIELHAIGKTESGDPYLKYVAEPWIVIVPVYHKIRLSIMPLLRWINNLERYISYSELFADAEYFFEWDVQLWNINKYKSEVLSEDLREMKPNLLKRYPRFFWIFSAYIDDVKIFDLIADATDMDKSFQFIYMNIFHDNFRIQLKEALNDKTKMDKSIGILSKRFYNFLLSIVE